MKHNPYDPPSDSSRQIRPSRLWGWVIAGCGCLIFAASIPTAKSALELANQEYLHLWRVRSVSYDIEFNGVPVSIDSAIRSLTLIVLVMWTFAIGLILWSRSLLHTRRTKN